MDEIADYIAADNLDAALRFYAAVRADAEQLARMPGMGPLYGLQGTAYDDARFLPVSGFRKYLLFYRRIAEGIEVLRILHGARDIQRQMSSP